MTNATEAIELAARRGVRRTQAVRPDHPCDPGAIPALAIPKEPHGAVFKRMSAEHDRNFLTGEFEKLLTEKSRLVAITQMSKRPAHSFCSR